MRGHLVTFSAYNVSYLSLELSTKISKHQTLLVVYVHCTYTGFVPLRIVCLNSCSPSSIAMFYWSFIVICVLSITITRCTIYRTNAMYMYMYIDSYAFLRLDHNERNYFSALFTYSM